MSRSSLMTWPAAAAALLAIGLPGQLTQIAQAGTGETVVAMLNHQRPLAFTSDGRLWSLVHFNDGQGGGERSQFLRLHVSTDNGKTWQVATSTRTTGSIRGSVATGTDGKILHVAWQAFGGSVGASVWYAAYDTATGQWLGTDLALAKGGNSTDQQYLAPSIAVTPKGTLVVAFYQHRQGMWPSWSAGMTYYKNGKWSAPRRVNVDTYGPLIDAMVHGEEAHFGYRTNSGLYGIRYRRFDTVTEKWGAEGEVQVSQQNQAKVGTASSGNCIAVAPNGDTYVIYATGDSSAGKGAIWVGHSAPGTYQFSTHLKVTDDAPMLGGNKSYYHYTLSRNFDGRVHILYSLMSEGHSKLYMRWLEGASIKPPVPIPLATGQANQFLWVAGHRAALGHFGYMATIRDTSVTGGRAWFYGGQTNGAVVVHGEGCQGSLPAVPWLGASTLPAVGQSFGLSLSDLPASQPGIVFLGLSDTALGAIPLPLSLAGLGMNGCFLVQDFFLTLPYAPGGQGTATLSVPLVNDPRLAGLPLYFQAFQLAPGANANNASMSNGISAIAR